MELLNHGDYAENLNTNFRIVGSDEPLDIELFETKESQISDNQESFSLLFRGGKDKFLPQGLYNVEHESLDNGMMFLVPVGEDENNYIYEAVFNRIKPQA